MLEQVTIIEEIKKNSEMFNLDVKDEVNVNNTRAPRLNVFGC